MAKLSDYIDLQPKQKEALKHIGTGARVFFGGARGGGKSHLALAAAVICAVRFPGIKIMVVRHTFPELEEVFIVPLQHIYPEKIFKYKYKGQKKVAVFANRSRIIFKAIETERDAKKAQGAEFQLLIIDEAPNFEYEVIIKLTGSLRNSSIPNFIPSLLMTGNPGGLSDKDFKIRFIRPDYDKWETGELKEKDKYIFVESNVSDNKYVGDDYIAMLNSLPEHLREAWLYGNWDIFEGAFFEAWNASRIVVGPFDIPKDWIRVAGFDLGFTKKHPTVCLWAAQNPDTDDIYIYREYTAAGSIELYANDLEEMFNEEEPASVLFIDPSMFTNNKRFESDESPGRMFQMVGLPAVPANNERVNGWRIVKAWMNKKLFIFNECQTLIQSLPTLRYTPYGRGKKEDLDTKMSDDAADALRYLLVSGFGFPMSDHDEPIEKYTKDAIKRNAPDERYADNEEWQKATTLHNAYY